MKRKFKVHFYKDAREEWRWTFLAKNGRKIAMSSESYKRFNAAFDSFHILRNAIIDDRIGVPNLIVYKENKVIDLV